MSGRGDAGSPGIRAVLLDFGGVVADEGFRQGLSAIARRHGIDPDRFFDLASDVIYETGYITGRGTESGFWEALRRGAGITGTDAELTGEILPRFVLRPRMMEAVRALRRRGRLVALLSDQTDWLERLDARDRFFRAFDRVFNSYRLGKGKRDPSVFDDVVRALGIPPAGALFVDDNAGHVARALSRGLVARLFRGEDDFLSWAAPLWGAGPPAPGPPP